ncbi:MAG: GH32 C-terminal domain-containing protein, partial [Gammaproteobacteria bacterium]
DTYLTAFFEGDADGGAHEREARSAHDWDQILTLPRRLTLRNDHDLDIEPAGAIESLRFDHRHIGRTVLPPNEERVLEEIGGTCIELKIEADAKFASMLEVNVLRSAHKEEFTRICFYGRRGFKYREPFPDDVRSRYVMSTALSNPVRYESVITIDTSYSSTLPDAISRPPESAPVEIAPDESVQLRVFVDRSVVEVFVNGRQCVAVRVYPGRQDSRGVSLLSRGRESTVHSVDCWQMKSIYERE